MKRNDIKALHEKSVNQLSKQLTEYLDKLAKARLEKTAGRLEDTSSIKVLADDVARIKTVIKEKQVLAEAAAQAEKVSTDKEVSKKEKSVETKPSTKK